MNKILYEQLQAANEETEAVKIARLRPIIQETVDGKFVNRFADAREAQRLTGVPRSSIQAYCNGSRISHIHGFKWKYAN